MMLSAQLRCLVVYLHDRLGASFPRIPRDPLVVHAPVSAGIDTELHYPSWESTTALLWPSARIIVSLITCHDNIA